jgi:glutaconyl-CoA decarboxylase
VDLLQALNITIYGLGIVFLALLVLMVAIMLLGKAFSLATGRELLEAPTGASAAPRPEPLTTAQAASQAAAPPAEPSGPPEAIEPVTAPLPGKILSMAVKAGDRVKAGDELCVIEALKMANSVKSPRDGSVLEVQVSPGDAVSFGATLVLLAAAGAPGARPRPAAPAPAAARPAAAAAPAAFALSVAGARHLAEVRPTADGAAVVVDGKTYDVRRDPAQPGRLLVDGRPHVVEVKEGGAGAASVVVDGVAQRVEIAPRAADETIVFTLAHAQTPHRVEVRAGDGAGTVSVDGTTFRVARDPVRKSQVLVNGKPHTVAVKERTAAGVSLWIDGLLQQVEITREIAPVAPAAPVTAPAAARVAAPAASMPGEAVTAPLPGKILSVAVKAGDRVKAGDELVVIEALKMGNSIRAQRDGLVQEVLVAPGQSIAFGASLVVLG